MSTLVKINDGKRNIGSYYDTFQYHQACQGIMNDLHELFFAEGLVKIDLIEKVVINNLDRHFTRTKMAKIAGVSVRTIRNKMNERI